MLAKVKRVINKVFRSRINKALQRKLVKKDITLIASNCNGAFILHDLELRFNSPYVNLYVLPGDFVKLLSNLEYYYQQELEFLPESSNTLGNYPIGRLADVEIHFMHYENEAEARQKWYQRLERQDLSNLFIMMTERDGCTYQDLVNFDNLPFANKVVFTHKPYPELSSAYYIKGFENAGEVGNLFDYCGFLGKKYYDQFDYVTWFNQGINGQQ